MNIKIITVIVLFLVSVSVASAIELGGTLQYNVDTQITCEVTNAGDCEGKNQAPILCLSDQTNAHAQLPEGKECSNNYNYALCCTSTDQKFYVGNECKGNHDVVAWLHDTTNSHISFEKDDVFSIPVCLSGLRKVECSQGFMFGSACVLSASAEYDAHVGGCNAYSKNIKCDFVSDGDDDGFDANKDCDDDNENVYPNADEVGDGLDNDCDGLIDGDDDNLDELPLGWYQLSKESGFPGYSVGGIKTDYYDSKEIFQLTDSRDKILISKKVKIQKDEIYSVDVLANCKVVVDLVFTDNPGSGNFGWVNLTNRDDYLNGSISVSGSSETAEYAAILIKIKGENDCYITEPKLELLGKEPSNYNDLTRPMELGNFASTVTSASCCGENQCWNGFACIGSMDTIEADRENFLVENVDGRFEDGKPVEGKAIYRCIAGEWVFGAFLYDWYKEESGLCGPDQCLIHNPGDNTVGNSTDDFYTSDKPPKCIDSGEFIFDHYCENSTWTSRTKHVANELLKKADANEDFSLYCTDLREGLINYNLKDKYILGEGSFRPGEGITADDPSGQITYTNTAVCFSNVTNEHINPEENTCINNVCVLKYENKVAFATSLNKNITDVEDSFLFALGIPASQFDEVCLDDDQQLFTQCTIEDFDGELYYSEELNAIIYEKEVSSGSFLETVAQLFDNVVDFFTDEETPEEFQQPTDYRDIYVLNREEQSIRAIMEVVSREERKIIVDYNVFDTNVCEYADHRRINSPNLDLELLELFTQEELTCQDNVVEVNLKKGPAKYFWPQLTGSLR